MHTALRLERTRDLEYSLQLIVAGGSLSPDIGFVSGFPPLYPVKFPSDNAAVHSPCGGITSSRIAIALAPGYPIGTNSNTSPLAEVSRSESDPKQSSHYRHQSQQLMNRRGHHVAYANMKLALDFRSVH
jgi:hypothetical protein